jgi:hypothetical protein
MYLWCPNCGATQAVGFFVFVPACGFCGTQMMLVAPPQSPLVQSPQPQPQPTFPGPPSSYSVPMPVVPQMQFPFASGGTPQFPYPSPSAPTNNKPTFPMPSPAPKQPTREFVFHNVSPVSVRDSALFTTSGLLDPNSLSEMTATARFEYNCRLGDPAGEVDGATMWGRSGAVGNRPSASKEQQLDGIYQQGKGGGLNPSDRGPLRNLHHQLKGESKLRMHYQEVGQLKAGATRDQDATEAGGEYAAARLMEARGYELKYGFKKGTGIDQIWVRRNGAGDVREYAIVEAKGWGVTSGQPSQLSALADKGWQMSPRWAYLSVMELAETKTNSQFNRLGQKIILAIIGRSNALVWGVCLTEQADRNLVHVRDCGVYNVNPDGGVSADVLKEWS